MPFSKIGISSELRKSLSELNIKAIYPIQKQAIPAILNGRDIIGIAKTGSGKTIAYVLPILERFLKQSTPSKNRHIKILVLVPTRELAVQVESIFSQLSKFLPEKVKSLAVYGGVSINPQMIKLQGTDILVATPGRLLELISSNAVSLSTVQTLVIDEADKMLNLGFKEEMDNIFRLLPRKRQTLLFSATLCKDLATFDKDLLYNPVIISIEAEEEEETNLEMIEQTGYLISEEKKGPLLRYLINKNDIKQVLIFASSVHRADAITVKLKANGIEAAAIHSQKSQGARTTALTLFKEGKLRALVATDLMARGIDIQALPYVINYELPRSPKDYVHRIGRTGRAGAKGEAISLISPEEEHHFKVIQKKMGKRAEMVDGNSFELQGV